MIQNMVTTYSASLNEVDTAWYLQMGANVIDAVDARRATDMQVKAKVLSSKVLKPQAHTYSKLTKVHGRQADVIVQWLKQFSNATDVVIAIENLYSSLIYSPNIESSKFKKCVYKIG